MIAPPSPDAHCRFHTLRMARRPSFAGAVGCMVYELLAGTPPFDAEQEDVLFYKIVDNSPDFPAGLSDAALSLIRALMRNAPSERLTAADALTHPWLAHADSSG